MSDTTTTPQVTAAPNSVTSINGADNPIRGGSNDGVSQVGGVTVTTSTDARGNNTAVIDASAVRGADLEIGDNFIRNGDQFLWFDTASFENLEVITGTGNDTVYAHQKAENQNFSITDKGGNNSFLVRSSTDLLHLEGGGGRDHIDAHHAHARQVTLDGNAGNDHIIGTQGNDLIRGGSGKDTLYGLNGNDRIYGQTGDDTISGGRGANYLNDGNAADHDIYVTGLGTNNMDRVHSGWDQVITQGEIYDGQINGFVPGALGIPNPFDPQPPVIPPGPIGPPIYCGYDHSGSSCIAPYTPPQQYPQWYTDSFNFDWDRFDLDDHDTWPHFLDQVYGPGFSDNFFAPYAAAANGNHFSFPDPLPGNYGDYRSLGY
jgi:Ca2+-binding RTX toxin-like protein